MIDPQPCQATFTDGMREIHRWIMTIGSVTGLMTLGVLMDRLRMLWADFRKKHKINGGQEV